ncbi:DUF4129 domain-containing protein [Curtobacterium aurantiacum]|uniref:DUF4129 domain-containing protein n=1 Tax=Curtobacterium aurantiacum TaxID=3236919 RepID=A0ABS5VAZ2_9MICO|nr:DUF4129 domain-containing protein [Curtobacterium flaccumfaciens]MBT1543701.1 DUF4129 domain-containing protein [Curtobacterium flaccumfaciens pv. flaccumfaciens]MBT1586654.1 DUF4129 domain-containing protein [Curtobacterium flaccumfaciens pv. flaccumfaciens]MBT1677993.1 DUF4129 domain-containing protein [Curtobacterium flaccumfaciens pv. flaccumfaciens]
MTTVDPDEARRLLERELDRSAYDGAQATWWDRASRSFLDWLGSLRADGLDSPAAARTALVIAIVVLVAVVVLVVVARGLPRRRARTGDGDTGGVFDADDLRSARALLEAAQAAVRRADWTAAVLDGFRAVARGLGERDLVPDVPGATARTIAARGAVPFPASAEALHDAATTFDAVRYLGADADEDAARRVLDTERAVREARPARPDGQVVPA